MLKYYHSYIHLAGNKTISIVSPWMKFQALELPVYNTFQNSCNFNCWGAWTLRFTSSGYYFSNAEIEV